MARVYSLDDTFEMIGAFWEPTAPDQKITGTLTSKKGRVSLSTAPRYSAAHPSDIGNALIAANGSAPFSKVEGMLGFTEGGECSLLAAIMLNEGGLIDFPSNQKVSNLNYRASAAVIGMHVESLDAKCIDSAELYFTKIRQSLPTPWSMTIQQDGNTHIAPSQAINVFCFKNSFLGAEVICEVSAEGWAKFKKETRIRSVARIRIVSDKPQSLEWYRDIGYRIENFFALILGSSISLKRFQMFRGEKTGWVIQAIRRREQKFNIQMWVKCDGKTLSNALDQWLSVPDEKRPVEKTLLGMLRKSSVFLETEFLSLAQALEGFSRLEGGNPRKEFRQRLEEIYDMLSPDFALMLLGKRDDLVPKIVATRNFFTHLGSNVKPTVVQDSRGLFDLNQRLHALLRCVMLIHLGIAESLLREPILYQSTRYSLW